MAARFPCLAFALLLAPFSAVRAGDATPPADTSGTLESSMPGETTPEPSKFQSTYEFDANAAYVGGARTNIGSGEKGSLSEQDDSAQFITSTQYNGGPLYRFGLAIQRYSFGLSRSAPIPDILESGNLVIGMDFELFNSWLVRIEADPGFYGDGRSMGFRDLNVPVIIGGSYIAGEDLQWVLGLELDVDRQIPVYPAVGVHWTITDSWVLDAVLPTPRLEYDYSKALTLYLGSDVEDATYRVGRDFGTAEGRPKLNGAVVEYDEIRLGAGFSWKAAKGITLELEAGYLPYREFDFHRADTHFSNDDGAPYGRMSINAQF